jgi:hypothetical protein
MADRITIDLPTGVLQRAELLALRAGRPVGDYLAETLQHALEPFGDLSEAIPQDWSNQEALDAADSRMSEARIAASASCSSARRPACYSRKNRAS